MATSAPAQTVVGAATGTDVRPVMLLTLYAPDGFGSKKPSAL